MKRIHLIKIVLAAAVCALAAPAWADDMSDMSTNPPATMTPMTASDFAWDAALINLKEIRLGEFAETNSQNADVQKFARRMVHDHTRLQDHLVKIADAEGLQLPDTNTFYQTVTSPPEKQATELMMGSPQDRLLGAQLDVQGLTGLSGQDFDHAYADAMVKGHAKAIRKYEEAKSTLQDERMKKYADHGLHVVREHYEMAQKLQAAVSGNGPDNTMTNSTPNM